MPDVTVFAVCDRHHLHQDSASSSSPSPTSPARPSVCKLWQSFNLNHGCSAGCQRSLNPQLLNCILIQMARFAGPIPLPVPSCPLFVVGCSQNILPPSCSCTVLVQRCVTRVCHLSTDRSSVDDHRMGMSDATDSTLCKFEFGPVVLVLLQNKYLVVHTRCRGAWYACTLRDGLFICSLPSARDLSKCFMSNSQPIRGRRLLASFV